MKYNKLEIVLANGITINQKEIAKITGFIYKTNKKIGFEIDLNNNKDVYNIFKNFKKELEENMQKIQQTTKLKNK